MISSALTIAAAEWRYWFRSKLGAASAVLAFILICTSLVATISQIKSERETREAFQLTAEETFRNQPARHPHRMVHYGHYVFRAPTSLAALDPGVEPYTGTVMFLEGHRQNSAVFSSTYDGAHAGPFARMTPALTYQLLVPIILIVMGFAVVAREREAATGQQLITFGVSPSAIWLGKTLALLSVAGLMLIPLLIGTVLSGSASGAAVGFFILYALYLVVWVMIIVAASTWSQRSSTSFLVLVTIWIGLCVLVPRVVASSANASIPSPSQVETEMDIALALRAIGDGHNANAPVFDQLKAKLLEDYGVERIEDLPINFRGVVAQEAEEDISRVMNKFADKRMTNQVAQVDFVHSLEFLSPLLALQSASMITAGTDVRTHHRYLREAEEIRYQFVQGLNKSHIEQMSYNDDINRSSSPEAEQRTRVSAENWRRVLDDFHFEPEPATDRLARIVPSQFVLILWGLFAACLGCLGASRLKEVNNG